MNTEFLARFIVVAEHGNITRAAHSLHLPQSTLSKQMMALEEEFGTVLFLRSNRSVELTEAGRVLYQQARPLLEQFQQLRRQIADLRPGGVLRLAAETAYHAGMNQFYRTFRVNHPEIRLDTVNIYYDAILERFFKGETDLGIIRDYELVGAAFEEEFDSLQLFRSDCVVRISTGHPLFGRRSVKLRELQGENFVYLRHLYQVGSDYFPRLIRKAGGVCVPDLPQQFDDLISMVASGAAIAFCERQSAIDIKRGTDFLEIEDENTSFHFLLVWRKTQQNPLRDLFLRELKQALPEIRAAVPVGVEATNG